MSDSFGQWLKKHRRAMDLTQDDLAYQLGSTQTAIAKIEAGSRRPSRQVAELLADFFQVPQDEREEFVHFARTGAGKPESPQSQPWAAAGEASPPYSTLPVPATPLIGRQTEVSAALVYLLNDEVRLLTLLGPPGIGKTRLGLEIASRAGSSGHFAGGIYFVGLAPTEDPGQVPGSIASALNLRAPGGQPLPEVIKAYLHDKSALLFLDNFEQVIDAAPFLGELLIAAPSVSLLVTSREVLRVQGEQEMHLLPLGLPDVRRLPSLDELRAYDAVALFVERARRSDPNFDLTDLNAPAVAAICRRLDGVPLGIELAAARIRLLPPQAMLLRLQDSFKLLRSGSRDLPARQRTLHDAIAWSYDLLDSHERTLFERFSVFSGGATLEAVESICSFGDDSLDTFEGIASFLDKSLLRQEEKSGAARLSMLEVIREYAAERLQVSGEGEAVRRRHANYYVEIAEQGGNASLDSAQEPWLARLADEEDNLRAALSWALDEDVDLALRLCGALLYFWFINGQQVEAQSWMDRAMALPRAADRPYYARALHAAGTLAALTGDQVVAHRRLEEAVSLYGEAVEKGTLIRSLSMLGMARSKLNGPGAGLAEAEESVALARKQASDQDLADSLAGLGMELTLVGRYSEARAALEESVKAYRRAGSKGSITRGLSSLGDLLRIEGDYEGARAAYMESLSLAQEIGLRPEIPAILHNLGHVALREGALDEAAALFKESLSLHTEMRNQAGIAEGLAGLAGLAGARDEPDRAARLFGAAERLRAGVGAPLWPAERADQEHNLAHAQSHLSTQEWEKAFAEGQAMTAEEAIAYALL